MIYKCTKQNCGFLFSRVGEVDRCPDCGGTAIREASPEEKIEYGALQHQNGKTTYADRDG